MALEPCLQLATCVLADTLSRDACNVRTLHAIGNMCTGGHKICLFFGRCLLSQRYIVYPVLISLGVLEHSDDFVVWEIHSPAVLYHIMSIVCSLLSDLGQSDDLAFWEIPSPAVLYHIMLTLCSSLSDQGQSDDFAFWGIHSPAALYSYYVDCLFFARRSKTKQWFSIFGDTFSRSALPILCPCVRL